MGLTAHIVFTVYFSPLVERFTRNEISKATNGMYVVDSMDVKWDILSSGLIINNFSLKSDSSQWQTPEIDSVSQPPMLDIYIPRIEVEAFNLLDFYREKHLKASALKIQKPFIQLAQINDHQSSKTDSLSTWRQFIPPSIQLLDIDLLSVEEGIFEFKGKRLADSSNRLWGVKNLNISIDHIQFDSNTNLQASPLDLVEDIQASGDFSDYPFYFTDYLHQFQLGVFELTSEDHINIRNIKLSPIFPSISLDSLVPLSIKANIPEIQFTGVNLKSFLAGQKLDLNKINIKQPNIQHTIPQFPSSDSASKTFLLPFLKEMDLGSLSVENGIYTVQPSIKDSFPILNLRGINIATKRISFENGVIDSTNILSIISNIHSSVDTLEITLKHAGYELLGNDFRFQADSGNAHLSQLRLSPSNNTNRTNIGAQIPEVSLLGIDIPRLFNEHKLSINSLNIHKPQIEFHQYWADTDSQLVAQWARFDGYHLIEDMLKELRIYEFKIQEGRLEVFQPQAQAQSAFQAKNVSLDIRQFLISPYTHHLMQAPFYAASLDLDFDIQGSSIILPDSSYSLAASSISFSTLDSTISADSILLLPLYPDSSSYLAQTDKVFLGIPEIRFKGLDFYQAYFQREVYLDSLWIRAPKVRWKSEISQDSSQFSFSTTFDSLNLYEIIEPIFKKVDVKYFAFEKAQVSQEININDTDKLQYYPLTSIVLDHFLVDSNHQVMGNSMLFAQDLTLQLENIERILPDSIHNFFVQNITYSSSKRQIILDTLYLTPNTRSNDERQNLYDITIPQIRINGLEAMEVYKEKYLSLSDVQIIDPIFSFINHPEVVRQEMDSLAQANLYDFISDYLDALEIENLVLSKGEVVLRNWDQKQENAFHADELFVFIKDFKVDSTSWATTDNRFYAQDIDIGMDANNYSFALPDSTYLLRIGNIGMSTEDSMFVAQQVRLIPLENQLVQRDADLLWEIEVPHFQVKGFEPAKWYFDRIARLKHIRIFQPQIHMEHLKTANPVEHDPMKVYNFISQHFQDLYIKDLFIEGADFEEVRLPGDTIEPLTINGLSLRAINVSPDSSDFLSPDRLFYSNNVRISIKDYSIDLPEISYQLDFGELGMHTASNQLYAKDLRFSPKLGIVDFFKKHGFSRDSLNCYIPDVKVEGVDLDALMHEQDFIAQHMLLQGLQLGVKKDKTYPENPNKRPPMIQEIIRNFPIYLKLDTITIANGDIEFVQHVPNLKKDASFSMDDLHADLYNITNDSNLLNIGVVAVLKAESRFMETGHLTVDFIIPLADTTNEYSFSGEIGRMKFDEFNPLLEQTAFVFVTDGIIQNGSFEVNAFQRQRKKKKEYIYKGKMRLRYSDLKLAVIDKKTMFEKDEYDEKKMASFLANTFVRSNNPKGRGRFLRIGKIYYEKEDNKAMIGHWVQALVSGIRSSVGLENKDERERIILPSFGKKSNKKKKQR